MKPEDSARINIDRMLTASGWQVQEYGNLNLGASLGVAVTFFPLGKDEADYVLFVDRNPVGVVEAKKEGHTLIGVTKQSNDYLELLHKKFPNAPIAPPFSYESTGIETLFVDRRDKDFRSRSVFTFHKPQVIADWLKEAKTLRNNLKEIPKLNYTNLWDCQKEAVINLEDSMARNKPRALIQMATGSGKTFTAVTALYRLIKHAKVNRVLFLVDRGNLGTQANTEFQNYVTPDDGRKFTELYNVQHLSSNKIDPVSKVVITTIQRMYSILKGEPEYETENEEQSIFELKGDEKKQMEVVYNSEIPIGHFDVIVVDEVHRSIYNKWKQVLDYFDSFVIGLTATPSKDTIAFFNENMVMNYSHERAVADGVNVGFDIFRIKTEVTSEGTIAKAKEWVDKRDKISRKKWSEILDEEIDVVPSKLDRDVVVPAQIRTVIKAFKDNLPAMFPDRKTVPKTLIFAKDDSHAEDITNIIREVFDKGNEFCEKITYKTTGKKTPKELIAEFRNSYNPRIAVTVDMIATGTDIKPLECVVFMRDVKSRNYFDQMKGRGCRVIDNDKLRSVTGDATSKDHFVIVDAVGVFEHDHSEMRSLSKKKGISFENLLQSVALGSRDSDTISTLADRLSRLNNKLDSKSKEEIKKVGGMEIKSMIHGLLNAIDPDVSINRAKEKFNVTEPTEEQVNTVQQEIVIESCKPFDNANLRNKIIEIKTRNEQIILSTQDSVLEAEFNEDAIEKSQKIVTNFKEFLKENRDELTALQIIYNKQYRSREITFADIQKLAEKLSNPPYSMSTELVWRAYRNLENKKVKANPAKLLTNIISLVRYSIGESDMLLPFEEIVNERFEQWLDTQKESGKEFTPEQIQWLNDIKEHIASSANVTLEDMDYSPFSQKGGLSKLYKIFGDDYEKILSELNKVLIS
jgi:type I restriction enzyme, R subunit